MAFALEKGTGKEYVTVVFHDMTNEEYPVKNIRAFPGVYNSAHHGTRKLV